jgi:methionine-S-sulfoxide reductase
VRTTVGYSGGTTETPDYRNMGDHSETVRVEFDPKRLSYVQLLEIFWESHDPGYDAYSRQYRNAIYYLSERQRREAEASRKSVADTAYDEVFTAIEPASEFFVAEDYHQKYLLRKATGILHEFQAIYPEPVSFNASTAVARINGYLGCNGEPEELQRELERLGLSPQMQERLVEHVSSSCDHFAGLTCPVRN